MKRYRSLVLGLLLLLGTAHADPQDPALDSDAAEGLGQALSNFGTISQGRPFGKTFVSNVFESNPFLSNGYTNDINTFLADQQRANSMNLANNIFLSHMINDAEVSASSNADRFSGPEYLPPLEKLVCSGSQVCVTARTCNNGEFTQGGGAITRKECDANTEICCTYRPPPPKAVPCNGNDYSCIAPNLCINGVIKSSGLSKQPKKSPAGCYAPEVCCRIEDSTVLTEEGYVIRVPETPFPVPTKTPYQPTQGPYKPTQAPYQPTQGPYKPTQAPYQPTKAPYQPTQGPYQPTKAPYQPTKAPYQPTQGPYQPTKAPYQPTQAPYQPTQGPYQPTKAPYQPTQGPYQPTKAPYQPTQGPYQPTQGPYQPTKAPYQPTQGPYQPTQGPYQPTKAPYQPTQGPYQPTKAPYQPTQGPYQPTQAPYQPTKAPYQPTQGPYQPTQTPYQPKPYQPTKAPYQPTQGPYQPTQGPYQPTKAPYQPTEGPYQPTQGPYQPTQGPYQPTKAPYQPTQGPYQPTKAPYQPTQGPYQPTKAPYQPTKAPYQPTQGPYQPTKAPYQPTQGPYQPTKAPYQPTKAPYQPTQGPYQPTQGPYQPTQGPYQPTKAPYQPTQGPYQPTKAPYQPTQGPYQPTKAPYQPTQGPYQPTKAPYQPTKAPYQPTQAPYQPTKAPYQPTQGPYKPTTSRYTPRPDPPFQSPTYLPPVTPKPYNPDIAAPSDKKPTRIPPLTGEGILSEPINPPQGNQLETARPTQKCAAALNCTEVQYCTSNGFISKTPVLLTKDQELYRVPLTDCQDIKKGIIGKCCRDPDYVDPWPVSQLGQYNAALFGDDGSYKPAGNGNRNGNGNGNGNGNRNRAPTQNAQASVITGQAVLSEPIVAANNQISRGFCTTRNFNGSPKGPGSYDAAFAEYPWQTMVLQESSKSLLCGGAIIADDVVLTSAHCVEGQKPFDVLVKGGEWKLGSDEEPLTFQISRVKKIDLHPKYDRSTLQHDIAILLLDSPLKFDQHIAPICIDEGYPSQNDECVTTGWGKKALKVHAQNAIMHHSPVTILPAEECQKRSDGYRYGPGATLCGVTALDTCELDAGSALACATSRGHYVLKGIFSAEDQCGNGQIVSFSSTDLSWIQRATGNKRKYTHNVSSTNSVNSVSDQYLPPLQ